jgi:GT2 family glycosyltransferase
MCSIDAARFDAASRAYRTALAGIPHEIVGIHGARSLAEGYNRGAARSRGELLVFSHDDVAVAEEQFGPRLLDHLTRLDMVGVAGCDRLVDGAWVRAGPPWIHGNIVHAPPGGPGLVYFAAGLRAPLVTPIHALDGVFIACRRAAWEQLRFDEATFDGFHLYDADFSFRAYLAGLRVGVAADLLLVHASPARYDHRWQRDARRFEAKFAGRLAAPGPHTGVYSAALYCRVDSLDAARNLRAALLALHYGA